MSCGSINENYNPSITALAWALVPHYNTHQSMTDTYLAIVAAELADDAAGGNVPVEDLLVRAARHQLRVVPANQETARSTRLIPHSCVSKSDGKAEDMDRAGLCPSVRTRMRSRREPRGRGICRF